MDKGSTDIRVVYPSPTVAINFPAAILKAPWVTSDQLSMAGSFRDYLLTRDVQLKAIDSGFRPALDDTRSAVDNALSSGPRANASSRAIPPSVDRPVGTKVIDDLLFQWDRIYGNGKAPGNPPGTSACPRSGRAAGKFTEGETDTRQL